MKRYIVCFFIMMGFMIAWAEQQRVVIANKAIVRIELASNRTTGYMWYLLPYDHHFLRLLKYEYQRADSKMMGAPGKQIWTFKVLAAANKAPMQLPIRLVQRRASQELVHAQQTVAILTMGK